MHALVTPAFADDLIVDDADPAVQLSGSWQTSATTPGFYGGGYLFHTPGHGAASARWPFPASGSAGRYRLYASWSSGANRATAARYQITSADGVTAVHVNQKNGGTEWHILGTFTFDPGANEGVTLMGEADGVVVADARVHAQHAGNTYEIRLIQPARLGPSGIWVVTSVELTGPAAAP